MVAIVAQITWDHGWCFVVIVGGKTAGALRIRQRGEVSERKETCKGG